MTSKIKIGNINYELSEVPCVDRYSALKGQIIYDESIIKILDDMNLEHKQETLLHEILHGLIHFLNIDLDNKEEEVVTQFARGIMMVIKDNPDLINYLSR